MTSPRLFVTSLYAQTWLASPCCLSSVFSALCPGLFVFPFLPVTAADAEDRPPPATQVFRAPDLWGGTDVAFEGCKANSGEYTLWVYAQGSRCGVPREEANRVVMFRQPLPGVASLRATSCLPGGRYFAWAYGSGEPGHPWINLCATTCVKGALPPTPGWILLGEIDLRDRHQLLLKSWEQPDGHTPSLSAIVV